MEGSAPGVSGALGNHAVSAPAQGAYKDGRRPRPVVQRGTVNDPGMRRRWRLLGKAAGLLDDKVPRMRQGREVVHYSYRVAMCQRGMDGGGVTIRRSLDGQRAEYGGLQTCGSPHHCPVCGPKMAARWVEQINIAMRAWIAQGGAIYFLTYTHQHDRETAGQGMCEAAADGLAGALSNYKGRRPYLNFRKEHGVVGVIRALESTYGELNGFHHHTHEIMLAAPGALVTDSNGRIVRWRSPLYRLARVWARVLIKKGMAGLKPGDVGAERFRKLRNLLTRCFVAQDGRYAAEYMLKLGKEPESWGVASELAKSHLKGGANRRPDNPRRCEHASPWELLNDALDGDVRSGELWREWAEAMHGRAKLYWSPRLKDRFGIPHIDDIELARAPDTQCVEDVITLGVMEWRLVLSRGARFDVLHAAATDGALGVRRLMIQLAASPPGERDDFDVINRDPVPLYTRLEVNGRSVVSYGAEEWKRARGGR